MRGFCRCKTRNSASTTGTMVPVVSAPNDVSREKIESLVETQRHQQTRTTRYGIVVGENNHDLCCPILLLPRDSLGRPHRSVWVVNYLLSWSDGHTADDQNYWETAAWCFVWFVINLVFEYFLKNLITYILLNPRIKDSGLGEKLHKHHLTKQDDKEIAAF